MPSCEGEHPGVAFRNQPRFVAVEQDGTNDVSPRTFRSVADQPNSPLDESERIAGPRLKENRVDVNAPMPCLGQLAEEDAIALLAFTLAAEEYPTPLRDPRTMWSHPICGTAPKAPPRYLR